jgi:hypothetical protein
VTENFRAVQPDPTTLKNLMIQTVPGNRRREAKDKVTFFKLTPEQVTKWDVLVGDRKKIVQPLREQIATLRMEIRVLLETDDLDATNLGQKRIKINKLVEEIKDARNTYIEGFKAILTEDQIKKLDIMLKREKQNTNPK